MPKIIEIGEFVHINRFGPPEELDEHTKLSISIFIAFYHAAVEKAHLLKVFFWLVFPLYRMVMMQRKLPRISKERMTTLIIFEGQLQAPDNIYLSGKRNLLIKVNGGHTSALVTLLLIYFMCNREYPKECRNSYLFLQREVLNGQC